MKKHNIPLIIGLMIIVLLIFVLIFKNDLIKIDPYSMEIGSYEVIDGKMVYDERPGPPSEKHLLGTDILGRDIYSQIIFGASITLKLVLLTIVLRFLLAIPFGMLAGFGNKFFIKLIQFFSLIFSSIPALLISIILLDNFSIKMLELNQSILIFASVLTFVGWGRLANTIQGHTSEILDRDFIQGEIAIGKNGFMIAIQNVLPHMLASIIVMIFLEAGNALLMVAELGVFGIYVGKPTMDTEALEFLGLNNGRLPSSHPEWGGMLASARYAITARKFWVIIYPAIAFFITIIGFNLFGEGIKYEIEKRDSKVITWIKRVLNQLSIKTFIYEIKNYKNYKRNIAIKVTIVLLIFIIPLLPSPKSKYIINDDELWGYVDELNCDEYTGRLVESKESINTVEFLESKLASFNIKPFFKDSYTSTKTIKNKNNIIINNQKIHILNDTNDFIYAEDFVINDIFYGFSMKERLYTVLDSLTGEIITTREFMNNDYDNNNIQFLLFDNNEDQDSDLINKVYASNNVKIILHTVNEGEEFAYKKPDIQSIGWGGPITGYISPEVAELLKENINNSCTFKWDYSQLNEYDVTNVAGIIEGKSNDKPILLTTNYDYYGKDYKGIYDDITSMAALLEIGNTLAKSGDIPEQSIIIAFTDASKYENDGAKYLTLNEYIDNNTFFINMNYLGLKGYPDLYYDTAYLSSKIYSSAELINYIDKRSEELGLVPHRESYRKDIEEGFVYTSRGSTGIVIKGIDFMKMYMYEAKKQNDISQIDPDILEKQVQTILDIIVNIAYK